MTGDIESLYLLERFVELYDIAIDVKKIPSIDSEEYRAFSSYENCLPIKLVYSAEHCEYFPNYPPFFDFYSNNDFFWMIPCEIPTVNSDKNKIIGFVLRSYYGLQDKKYMNFHVVDSFPLIYGLADFGDFVVNSPIIITEGIKDALFLKKYYKHTISCLTSSINSNVLNMLCSITKNFVLAYDKDSAGKSGHKKNVKNIQNKDASVKILQTPYDVKDWGNFFSIGLSQEKIDSHLHTLMQSVITS